MFLKETLDTEIKARQDAEEEIVHLKEKIAEQQEMLDLIDYK